MAGFIGVAGNPTYDAAADTLTALEGGAATLLFGSGMAAATAVFQALDPGDHVIVPKVMYWALRAWLVGFATRWGLKIEQVDNGSSEALRAAVRRAHQARMAGDAANPTWAVSDIADAARDRSHRRREARRPIRPLPRPCSRARFRSAPASSCIPPPNTSTATPTLLRARCTAAATDEFWARIKTVQVQNGGIAGPFEGVLAAAARAETFFARVRWQCTSAAGLAARLQRHPAIAEVLYPGLPDFPGHDVARRQMQGGFGGAFDARKGGRRRPRLPRPRG